MTYGIRKAFLFTAVPVLVIISLYAFRGVFFSPIIKRIIIKEAEQSLGVHLTIRAVKGSYFSNLTFHDIELSFPEEQAQTQSKLSIKEGSVYYNPRDLLESLSSFLQNSRIDVNGLEGGLNLQALLLLKKQPHQEAEDLKNSVPFLIPHIKVHDSALMLFAEEKCLSLSGLLFNFTPKGSSGMFTGGEGEIFLEKAVVKSGENTFAERSFSAKFEVSENRLTIKNVYLDNTSLISQTVFSYEVNDGPFSLNGSMDFLGGQLQASAIFHKSNVKAQMQLEGLNLMNLQAFSSAENTPINGYVSGSATVSLDTEDLENLDAALLLEVRKFASSKVHFDNLTLQAKSRSGMIYVEHLESTLGQNKLFFQDILIPIRYVFAGDAHSILRQSRGNATLKLEDIPKLYRAVGASLPEDIEKKTGNHSLTITAHIKDGLLTVSKGKLQTQTGAVDSKYCEIQIPEVGSPLFSTEVKAAFRFDIPEIYELISLFGLPQIYGQIEGELSLTGSLTSPQGRMISQGKDLNFKGIPLGNITLEAATDGGKITFQNIALSRNSDRASLTGAYDFTLKNFQDLFLKAEVVDIAPYAVHIPQLKDLEGNVNGNIRINGPLYTPDLSLQLKGAGLKAAAGQPSSEIRLDLTNKGKLLQIENLTLTTDNVQLLLAGNAKHDISKKEIDFSLTTLNFSRNKRAWKITKPTLFTYIHQSGLEIEGFVLEGQQDSFKLHGSLPYHKDINIITTISSHTGEGWIDLLGEELTFQDASLDVVIEGNINQPIISAKGRASQVGSRNFPNSFTGSFDFIYSPAGIDVRHFSWKTVDGSHIQIKGILPVSLGHKLVLNPGDLDFAVSLNMPDLKMLKPLLPEDYSSVGSAQAEVKLAGTWNKPSGSMQINTSGIDAPILSKYFIPVPLNTNLSCRLEHDQILLENFSALSQNFEIHSKGKLSDFPSFQDLFQKGEKTSKSRIDGKIDLTADDIGWIAGRVKKLKKISGGVKASFTLGGALAKPEITGSLTLEKGELRPETAIPPMRNVFLKAALINKKINLQELHGEIGGSPFRAFGSINIGGDIPLSDIHIIGENLLFYREEGVKVRADADLSFAGATNKLHITGMVSLTDGSFTKNFDFLSPLRGSFQNRNLNKIMIPSFHEEPLKNAVMDISITAKNPFQLKNNIAKGQIVPELKVQGTGEAPYLIGKLYIDGARIELPAGRLKIDNGLITFPENDPDNPQADIQGSSRIAGYDITLNIQGRLDEPVVTLSSSPPLSEEDLLQLVLTGRPPSAAHGSLAAKKGKNIKIALYLAQGVLAQFFGQESKLSDTDFLERFEFDVGKGITKKGDETIDVQFLLSDEVITDGGSLYITSEKDVFDAYNLGLKILFRFE